MPSKHSARSGGRRTDTCRECGRHEDEAGTMSARDLCRDCGARRALIPSEQLAARSGPVYDEYVRGMIEYGKRLAASQ